MCGGLLQVIYRESNDLRKQNPNSVGQEDAQCTHHIAAAVLLKIGKQWEKALGQHVLLDAILTAQASVFGCSEVSQRTPRLQSFSYVLRRPTEVAEKSYSPPASIASEYRPAGHPHH